VEASSLIRALRDRPYDLLVALERRGRTASSEPGEVASADREWVGVAWRMAGEAYLVAREEMREVLNFPSQLTRVPGSKQWVKGLANVRGALLPVIDLRQYLGSGATPLTRNTRLLVVNHRDVPAGLMVDEVLGFRRFTDGEFGSHAPPTIVRCERYVAGAFKRGAEAWPVLSLRLLVENPGFLDAAA
jgi:twitching motility protein PilI